MFKIILILLFFTLSIFSRNISLNEINNYPKSIAKDFYIWQYLQQPWVSKENAEFVFKQVSRSTPKLRKALKRRGGIQQLKSKSCKILSIPAIMKTQSIKCVKSNLTPKRVTFLDGAVLRKLIVHFKKIDKDLTLLLMAIYYSQDIEKTLYSNPEIYLDIFLNSGSKFRKSKKINKILSKRFIQKLVIHSKKFEKFVENIIAYPTRFAPLKKALLNLEPSKKMTNRTLFTLAFNLIKNGQDKRAVKFFKFAKQNGWFQIYKDMATFWLYLTTKNKQYLQELLKSWDINIYTLYAREELKRDFPSNILSHTNFYKFKSTFTPNINPNNPFDWIKVKREINKFKKNQNQLIDFANMFKNIEHIGIHFYILERGFKFKKQSFPTPYRKYLSKLSIYDQAQIYALARQESKFIPSVVSTSYALGMMQIMPFLVKDIAKRKGEKIELEAMFNPIKNLEYSIFHLQTLKKQFISPLFIAYAYNGGGGFTRRMLKSGMFSKGKYEPFLSMETVSFSETRKYGKKVLANYVVYRRLLNKPISLHHLLSDLTQPTKSDFIRKRK